MKEVFAAFLFFAFFWLEIFLGSLSLWAFQNLFVSRPLSALKPTFQKALWLIFPLVLFFVILSFGLSTLFPWAQATGSGGFRAFYLNPTSFLARTFLYFLVWMTLSFRILKGHSLKAPLVLILAGLTTTFVSIDWILSLDPHYRSSAFGLVFFMSSALMAFAFSLRSLSPAVPAENLIKLNNIHLALIGSWAYVVFMEYLIVWYGNTPDEVSWFVPRTLTSWKSLAVALILLQFGLPIFLLFFRALKKTLLFTRSLALLTVTMQTVFLLWLILPSLNREGLHLSIFTTLALLLAMAGPVALPRWIR